MDERVRLAAEQYERAVFQGDATGLAEAERQLDAAEAELALVRGKLLHARVLEGGAEDARELELYERALELYEGLGDERGQAEALFWIGCFHQVVRGDAEPADAALAAAEGLARWAGDNLILSYVVRHQGISAHQAGRAEDAGRLLAEAAELRRGLGFSAGVAANMVGLVHLAIDQGRLADAEGMIDEATVLAQEAGATAILNQLEQARGRL